MGIQLVALYTYMGFELWFIGCRSWKIRLQILILARTNGTVEYVVDEHDLKKKKKTQLNNCSYIRSAG